MLVVDGAKRRLGALYPCHHGGPIIPTLPNQRVAQIPFRANLEHDSGGRSLCLLLLGRISMREAATSWTISSREGRDKGVKVVLRDRSTVYTATVQQGQCKLGNRVKTVWSYASQVFISANKDTNRQIQIEHIQVDYSSILLCFHHNFTY